jgi:kynurenine formamidase
MSFILANAWLITMNSRRDVLERASVAIAGDRIMDIGELGSRNVMAIGHDTTDTDPGPVVSRGEAPLEDYWLRQDKWQIELLPNLQEMPPAGALIVASWPKPQRGPGFQPAASESLQYEPGLPLAQTTGGKHVGQV